MIKLSYIFNVINTYGVAVPLIILIVSLIQLLRKVTYKIHIIRLLQFMKSHLFPLKSKYNISYTYLLAKIYNLIVLSLNVLITNQYHWDLLDQFTASNNSFQIKSYWNFKLKNNFYLNFLFLAASDFFFFFTLGFS